MLNSKLIGTMEIKEEKEVYLILCCVAGFEISSGFFLFLRRGQIIRQRGKLNGGKKGFSDNRSVCTDL